MTKLYSTPIRHMILTVWCWLANESYIAALSVILKTPIQKKFPKKLSCSIDSLMLLSDPRRVRRVAARMKQTAHTIYVYCSDDSLAISFDLLREYDMLKQKPEVIVEKRPIMNSEELSKVSLVVF